MELSSASGITRKEIGIKKPFQNEKLMDSVIKT
jgi:hypothetical protein